MGEMKGRESGGGEERRDGMVEDGEENKKEEKKRKREKKKENAERKKEKKKERAGKEKEKKREKKKEQEYGKKEFAVQGGDTLLTYLTANNIKISSSCAGKASCGYCKVQVPDGGGQILPTEEIWMSRQEKLNNMRLACQVKIKNDITIEIPDFLTVVHQMVLSKNFDANKKWLVKIR